MRQILFYNFRWHNFCAKNDEIKCIDALPRSYSYKKTKNYVITYKTYKSTDKAAS